MGETRDYNDTIAAISTGMVSAGLAVIRISGPQALAVADAVFEPAGGKSLSDRQSHTLCHGTVVDSGEPIDDVVAKIMRSPRSYTGEDVVEMDCHGGLYVVRRVLDAVTKAGARLAEPGEFTKRAFLNGKMDLSRAEAVASLISSENEKARRASLGQLFGRESGFVKESQTKIMNIMAFGEAALDDPEHISVEGEEERLITELSEEKEKIDGLWRTAGRGRLITEGIRTVIAGRPNVGKSSLLNLLLGEERAIVSDIAGTTRDVIGAKVNLGDFTLNMIDTAGINMTDDPIEKIGVDRAQREVEQADLILAVMDGNEPLDENDEKLLAKAAEKPVIGVINKNDLPQVLTEDEIRKRLGGAPVVSVSATENTGIGELKRVVEEMFFTEELSSDDLIVLNKRHEDALKEAEQALDRTVQAIRDGVSEEFWLVDLKDAYDYLGVITGENVGENLIDEIFSQFCMGK